MEKFQKKLNIKNENNTREERGSITLFVLISMLFFLIVVIGAYISINYKMQNENKEIEKIKKEYEKTEMNDVYGEAYKKYLNTETPTIELYEESEKRAEIAGRKKNYLETVYANQQNVTLKFKSSSENNSYVYLDRIDGNKHDVINNEITISATTEGTTIYVYLKDQDGNLSKYYTAITVKLNNI